MKVPSSAADAKPGDSKDGSGLQFVNPVHGKAMLTPSEALDAISRLSAMLLMDERYRSALEARKVPE